MQEKAAWSAGGLVCLRLCVGGLSPVEFTFHLLGAARVG